jgi:hypothetical protein
MDRFKNLKERLLSTSNENWKNILSSAFLSIFCALNVTVFGYFIFIIPNMLCHKGFFYLAILWLIAEALVIGYLYFHKNVPRFARDALVLTLLISNIWFILFVFGLRECS